MPENNKVEKTADIRKTSFIRRLDAWDKRILLRVSRYQKAPFVFILRALCRSLDPMIIILILAVMIMGGARRVGELMSLTLFVSSLTAYAVKRMVSRPRPNYQVRASKPPDPYSFPSGHTTVAFALLIVFWPYFPEYRSYLIAFAFLVAGSRIYLGVHYPLDVLGGFIVGILSGFFMLEFLQFDIIKQFLV